MRKFVLCLMIAAFVLAFASVGTAMAATVYVNPGAIGGNHDGTSWDNGFLTVQQAMLYAQVDDQIWVRAGTYVGQVGLRSGVSLYGGFAGNETSLDQRNWQANITTLDGNLATTVIYAANSTDSRVDGFTIQQGRSQYGAGIYLNSSSVDIENNRFTNNIATVCGGAIYLDYSSVSTIRSNYFEINNAMAGGAIAAYNNSSLVIEDNMITRSTADAGGGIYLSGVNATVYKNTILANWATQRGGGIYALIFSGQTQVSIVDNKILNNTAIQFGGGGVYVDTGLVSLTNNLITGNTSALGGGIFLSRSDAELFNNTICNNTANGPSSQGGAIYTRESTQTEVYANNIIAFNNTGIFNFGSNPLLFNNDVFNPGSYNYDGLAAGATDIQVDPLFVDRVNDDYHLQLTSPCVDTGSNNFAPPNKDIDDHDRIQNITVDIGAYESPDLTPPVVAAIPLGGIYTSDQLVMFDMNEAGYIYYTLDGSTPTTSSQMYWTEIPVTANTTLKFIGVDIYGNATAPITEVYVIDKVAPIITATPPGGTYSSAQTVTLTADETADIYYTLDGSTPSTASAKYSTPIAIAATATLKYIGVDTAGNTSSVGSQTYTIDTLKPSRTGVTAYTTVITITFDEDIVAYSGTSLSGVTLKKGTKAVSKTVSVSGNQLIITPTTALTAGSTYSVGIPINTVKDAAGNGNDADSFSVVPTTPPDTTAPTVVSTSPVDGATGVRTTSTIKITFSENTVASTAYGNITINGSTTGFTKTISGTTLTLTKTLLKNTPYTVVVPASAVKDAAGNDLANAKTFSFTTGNR